VSEHDLRQLPNIGPATARMLLRIRIHSVDDLRGQNPAQLFDRLCDQHQQRLGACVLDTLTAVVDYANGAPARPWWYYSRLRKAS
jgi:hypothetical protein